MNSVMQRYLRTAAALGALGLAFATQTAHAVGTPAERRSPVPRRCSSASGTSTRRRWSPTPAAFRVDRVVNFSLASPNGTFGPLTPRRAELRRRSTCRTAGNGSQGFALTATNMAAGTPCSMRLDSADIATLEVWHHPTDAGATFNPTTRPRAGSCRATGRLDRRELVGGRAAGVRARGGSGERDGPPGRSACSCRSGCAGRVERQRYARAGDDQSGCPEPGGRRDRDAGNSATAISAFQSQPATVAVTKTLAVISDPFSTSNPKAIPGAVVEYIITSRTPVAPPALRVGFTDPVPRTRRSRRPGTARRRT
jgi:hypothetical protein